MIPLVPGISIAFQSDKTPEEYAALGRMAETYGFEVVSVYGDLMFQPPLYGLLILAQHTARVRLGPACLNPFTLHPVEIAGQVAALDAVSHGRAYLGLARGTWLDSVGLAQAQPLQRLRETIEVVRHLLAGERAEYRGKIFQLSSHNVLQYQPVRSSIPILIGTWGAKLGALAGEVAGEVKIGGSANPDMVEVMRGAIAVGADRVVRDAGEVGIVLGAVTVVDEDGEEARQCVRREVALYLPVVAALDPTVTVDPELLRRIEHYVRRGEMEDAGQLVPEDVLGRFAIAGTPRDVIAQTRDMLDAGASRVEFGTPHGLTEREGVRLLGERVIPAFR